MRPEVDSLALSRPSLVIDGSGSAVFVGLLSGGEWIAKVSQESSPLEGLFPSVETVLGLAQCQIADVSNFIYCEGPGSVLGLRLCAMAIQTWGHLGGSSVDYFAYNSLELTASLIALDNPDIGHALLISDWKKNAWNSIKIEECKPGAIIAIDDQKVNRCRDMHLFYLPQRKNWQKIPENANTIEYSPQRLPEVLHLLKRTKKIELYSSNVNVFEKWEPQRHRAPV